MMSDLYYLLLIFYIYSFLGWCTEVGYAALKHGTFVNRGFLNGPVCPIYGLGVLIVLLCLDPLKGNWLLLFLGSVVLTSLLEGITGYGLEKIFHQHWWDYSKEPFNLAGYVCLRFSIMWGFACVFVVDVFHPTVLFLIHIIPDTLGWIALALSSVVMVIDMTATVRTITKLRLRQSQIDEIAWRLHKLSDEFGENLADSVLNASEIGSGLRDTLSERADTMKERREERLEDWKENVRVLRESINQILKRPIPGQARLLRAFPEVRASFMRRIPERLHKKLDKFF